MFVSWISTAREHQHIEWKEPWRDEYQKWICGFANAGGGILVEFRFLPEHTVPTPPKITGEVAREVERLVLALEGRMSRVQIQQAMGLGMRITSGRST